MHKNEPGYPLNSPDKLSGPAVQEYTKEIFHRLRLGRLPSGMRAHDSLLVTAEESLGKIYANMSPSAASILVEGAVERTAQDYINHKVAMKALPEWEELNERVVKHLFFAIDDLESLSKHPSSFQEIEEDRRVKWIVDSLNAPDPQQTQGTYFHRLKKHIAVTARLNGRQALAPIERGVRQFVHQTEEGGQWEAFEGRKPTPEEIYTALLPSIDQQLALRRRTPAGDGSARRGRE